MKVPKRRTDLLLTAMMAVLFLAAWQWAIWFFAIPPIIIPAPLAVLGALRDGIVTGELPAQFLVTFGEVVMGFLAGAVLGLAWGVLVGLFPLMERLVYPYIVAFQTVPKVAIAPIIVIWFGYGMTSKVIITATIAFFPVLANTIVGLRSAPRDQVELMIALTASRWQIFRLVRFPQALPYIFVGLDVAIVLAVIGAIVGEFVGAQAGLGYLILQRDFNLDMAGVFAILLILSALGIGLHSLVTRLQRRVVFWMDYTGDRTVGA
jgi:NitT/TauT family transport system permease protein